MSFENRFHITMGLVDRHFPTRSARDVAIVKLVSYLQILLPFHTEMVSAHPGALWEYRQDNKFRGVKPEQMRYFVDSNAPLRSGWKPFLDELREYFINAGQFDRSLIGEKVSDKLMDRSLGRLMGDPSNPEPGILTRASKGRYMVRFKGSYLDVHLPFLIKAAVDGATDDRARYSTKTYPTALIYDRPRSDLIKERPDGEFKKFEKWLNDQCIVFCENVKGEYFRTFLKEYTTDKERLDYFHPGVEILTGEEALACASGNVEPGSDLERRVIESRQLAEQREKMLSMLPLIVLTPMGWDQLEKFTKKR